MTTPHLVARSGLFQGSSYEITTPFTLGRHPSNSLHLTDHKVSRFHAAIERTPEGLVLRDLDSRNGTWVNGKRIQKALLRPGDEIRIGGIRLVFEESPSQESLDPTQQETPTEALVRFRMPVDPHGRLLEPVPMEWIPESAQKEVRRLQLLYRTNMLLGTQMELEGIFKRLLEQVFRVLPAHRGVVYLVDPKSRTLKQVYARLREGIKERPAEIMASQTILHEVMRDRCGLLIQDTFADERFSLVDSIVEQDIRSALCVPLLHQGEPLGVIYLDALGSTSIFSEDDLQLLNAMAVPAALHLRNLQVMEEVARSYLDTIQVLANAIEARDHYTVGHTWRVTRIALSMACEMGWDPKRLRQVEMGGILHDIGKIAVEDRILRKTSRLTAEEYQKMRLHPEHGARILKDVEFLKSVIAYVLFHQERWDGGGYPFQLKGDEIPIEGRLLSVPDAFDAMTSQRPYRRRLSPEEAVEEIVRNRGKQFDPQMVEVFLEVWKRGEISSVIQYARTTEQKIPCPFCSTLLPMEGPPKEGLVIECPVCGKHCLLEKKGGFWKSSLA